MESFLKIINENLNVKYLERRNVFFIATITSMAISVLENDFLVIAYTSLADDQSRMRDIRKMQRCHLQVDMRSITIQDCDTWINSGGAGHAHID